MSSDNMLAVWKTKQAAGLELKDAPIPKIKDDEVLIKVKATSICGTDRHIYLWDAWAQKRIGKTVSVFGMGPIGICAVALCKEAGAEKIIAVDPNDFRLKFAKDFGADVLVKARDTNVNVQKEILEETDGMGVDVFLEISGSASAITDGIATLRAGGRASILGVFSNPFLLDMNKVVFGNIRLTGINGRRMFDTWYKAASFLRSGKVKLEKLVTHRLKLSEIERGFEILERGEGMKVVLEP